jgi:hypothetical protein
VRKRVRKKMLVLDEAQITSPTFDVERMTKHISGRTRDVVNRRGHHYRTLMAIADQYTGALFIDLGTHRGGSAMALGINPHNDVLTYDITDFWMQGRRQKGDAKDDIPNRWHIERFPNISFKMRNCLNIRPGLLGKAHVILLDLHPHDGIQERAFMEILHAANFKGVLIMDDVDTFEVYPELYLYYRSRPQPKTLVEFAHAGGDRGGKRRGGTGVLSYGEPVKVVYMNGKTTLLNVKETG